jgi:glucose-6-phosphate dehydrogenase assembly protein OpcA
VIIDLPSTTTSAVNRSLVDLRERGGAVALGRVMTLVIVAEEGQAEDPIEAANAASREHPCRVIAVVRGNRRGASRLDAQIRVGGDAGASEVIVLRLFGPLARHGDACVVPLLLPDAPIVAWWPGNPPEDVAGDPIGRMAQRRITDSAAAKSPSRSLTARRHSYADGDTDFAWTRITRWRALLAAALDQPPFEPVTSATVVGAPESPSAELLAAWLALALQCPVTRARSDPGSGILSVHMDRAGGPIDLVRPDGVATLTQPGQPERRISLPRRETGECLSEELRRLDPDDVYGEVLTRGLPLLAATGRSSTHSKAAAAGQAVSPGDAARRQDEADQQAARTADAMASAQPRGEHLGSPPDAEEPDAGATVDTDTGATADTDGERSPA